MKHIALFSQTGSEVAKIMANGFEPDMIFYDQKDEEKIHPVILKR